MAKAIVSSNARAVQFTGGGEPLLNPDTIKAIVFAHSIDKNVGLITNGSKLTPELTQYCTWIRVSLDAYDAESYKRTHGVGVDEWMTVLENVSAAVRVKGDCTIGLGYLTDEQTIEGAEQAIKLAQDLGVDYIQFRPYQGSQFDPRPILAELSDWDGVLTSEARYDRLARDKTYHRCYAAACAMVLGADGKIYQCCDTKYRARVSDGVQGRMSLPVHPFCPTPCRHEANNEYLNEVLVERQHAEFV